VSAAVALFFVISQPPTRAAGIFLLFLAGCTCAAAEVAVSQARFYRYGIEEALLACSVGFSALEGRPRYSADPIRRTQRNPWSLLPAQSVRSGSGIVFGLPYAPLFAIIFGSGCPIALRISTQAFRLLKRSSGSASTSRLISSFHLRIHDFKSLATVCLLHLAFSASGAGSIGVWRVTLSYFLLALVAGILPLLMGSFVLLAIEALICESSIRLLQPTSEVIFGAPAPVLARFRP
jgi:hypothetical protein